MLDADRWRPVMLNRCLALLVAALAPASAAALVIAGAHPVGAVSLAERAPCLGLALLSLALAVANARVAPPASARVEVAMWSGLAIFFSVATVVLPRFGTWGLVAGLLLAATSLARLAAAPRRSAAVSQFPARRRIFA
jgi:hypothetical protein